MCGRGGSRLARSASGPKRQRALAAVISDRTAGYSAGEATWLWPAWVLGAGHRRTLGAAVDDVVVTRGRAAEALWKYPAMPAAVLALVARLATHVAMRRQLSTDGPGAKERCRLADRRQSLRIAFP